MHALPTPACTKGSATKPELVVSILGALGLAKQAPVSVAALRAVASERVPCLETDAPGQLTALLKRLVSASKHPAAPRGAAAWVRWPGSTARLRAALAARGFCSLGALRSYVESVEAPVLKACMAGVGQGETKCA